MNKTLFFLFLLTLMQINCKFSQKIMKEPSISSKNNYLTNDFVNLIGLHGDYAKEHLENLYMSAFNSKSRIEMIDNLIICKPVLGDPNFSSITMYLLLPTITLVKNNNDIVSTVISSNIRLFDITQIIIDENIGEENIKIIQNSISAYEEYSRSMLEKDEWFDIFTKTTMSNIPLEPTTIEITITEKSKAVKYIWSGSKELHEYIGKNNITKIEYSIEFNFDYIQMLSLWSNESVLIK